MTDRQERAWGRDRVAELRGDYAGKFDHPQRERIMGLCDSHEELRRALDDLLADQGLNEDASYALESARRAEALLGYDDDD